MNSISATYRWYLDVCPIVSCARIAFSALIDSGLYA